MNRNSKTPFFPVLAALTFLISCYSAKAVDTSCCGKCFSAATVCDVSCQGDGQCSNACQAAWDTCDQKCGGCPGVQAKKRDALKQAEEASTEKELPSTKEGGRERPEHG